MTGSQAVTIVLIGICVLAFGYSMMNLEDPVDCTPFDRNTQECYHGELTTGEKGFFICPKNIPQDQLEPLTDCKFVKKCCEGQISKITREYALVPSKYEERPETFITSMFLHWDIQHLFGNMLFLFFIGAFLESLIGSGRYIVAYIASGLAGGIGVILAPGLGLMSPDAMVVGASGAIFGIIAAVAILKPMEQIYLFFFPMPMFLFGLLYVGLQVYYMFTGGEAGVANIAHFGGAVAGIIFGLYFRFVEKRHLTGRVKQGRYY